MIKTIEEKVEELKKEIMEYYELFFKLFDQQSYEKTINYTNLLKQEIKIFQNL